MRIVLYSLLALLVLGACNEKKKSDVDLFDEGRLRVQLSADVRRGHTPLMVRFNAYLENDQRQIAQDIEEAKWIITGPDGYDRELVHMSENLQDEEDNKKDSFYFEQTFYRVGTWRIRLILNDGEFSSNPVSVRVLDSAADPRSRKY